LPCSFLAGGQAWQGVLNHSLMRLNKKNIKSV